MAQLLGAGRPRDAERLCREVLVRRPRDAARFEYALGHALAEQSRPDEAAAAWERAVALDPAHWEAQHALAMLVLGRGDAARALVLLQQAAAARGARPEVHFNLGALHLNRGAARAAIDSLRRAVTLDERFAPAWHALGLAHRAVNENEDALAAIERALRLQPDAVPFLLSLGQVLLDLNRPGAEAPLGRAAALQPGDAAIADQYAQALAAAGRLEAADAEHRRARALAADAPAFRLSHARSLARAGRANDAMALLRQVAADPQAPPPDKAAAHAELAAQCLLHGDGGGGRAAYDAALALAPEDAAIRLQRAMLLLSQCELDEGWRDFEARFAADMRAGGILAQPFPQPRWEGSDLAGRTIVVWSEQGIGDDILFASMIPDLARRAGEVLVHVDARLVPIFARSFPANVRCFGRVRPVPAELLSRDIDRQIPFGSLGRYLRPDVASFGRPSAYLRADADTVAHFRRRYADLPGLKIGIAWRSQNLVNGRFKSSDLAAWGPILSTPGLSFINLQYGDCAADLARARAAFGVEIVADPDVDQLVDMDTFMAQVAALDGVVSVSNAIAHTAGALGQRTLVLLPTNPLWIWFRGRDDSPWYPRVRLFRQTTAGDWRAPVEAAAAELAPPAPP